MEMNKTAKLGFYGIAESAWFIKTLEEGLLK
jgi:hypothetical protein